MPRPKAFLFLRLAPAFLGLGLGTGGPVAGARDLSYRVHWLGHSGDGASFQSSADCLAVAADGTCAVGSRSEAGDPRIGLYRDGRLVGQCAERAAPGPGFVNALAFSETHLLAAVTVISPGGNTASTAAGDLPAEGTSWQALVRFTLDGQPAPFPGGRGPGGALRVVEETAGPPGTPALAGLWIDGTEVFVSDATANRIRVFDAATMTEERAFRADRPSGVCVLAGTLQVIERGAVVTAFTRTGRRTGQVLDEGDELRPGAVAPAPDGRLMVSDLGAGRQVHFFNMSGVPTRVRTLGEEFGLYGPPTPGEAGPRRFAGVTGVGADASGNLFVSMSPPPGGCVLRSFAPDRTSLRWQTLALALRHGADADPRSDALDLYSAEARHALDLTKPPGSSWRWVAQTLNAFRYPDDPRTGSSAATAAAAGAPPSALPDAPAPPPPAPGGGTTTFREIDGHKLLAVRSSDGSQISMFRIQAQTAVPALTITAADAPGSAPPPPDGTPRAPWIWRDANADGRPDATEITAAPAFRGRFAPSPIDARGALWLTTEDHHIFQWSCQGLDELGTPTYNAEPAASIQVPLPPQARMEVHYEAAHDTLYRATAVPDASSAPVLSLEALEGWSRGPATTTSRWRQRVPTGSASLTPPGLSAAGDLVFAMNAETGQIDVFESATGAPLGQLRPPAAQAPGAGRTSSIAVRAHRRRDGSYVVLAQDSGAQRILAYHLDDPLR